MNEQPASLWRLADYVNGFPFKPDDFDSEGVPVVRIRQLVNGAAEVDLTRRSVPQRHQIRAGDLIFSWSGSLAIRVWDREPAWLNQHLFRVVPVQGVHQGWLRWVLDHSIERFQGMMHGSAMTHLTLEMLKQVLLPVPSFDEQRRIADFLDAETSRLNDVEAMHRKVGSALVSRTQALLDLEMDRFAEHFGVLPFRRSIVLIEQGVSPQCDNVSAGSDAWGVLKVSAVKNGAFVETENKQLPPDIEPERRHEIKHGDLLITRANTPSLVGAAAVADSPRRKLMLCDKIFRVSTAPGLDRKFLVLVASSTKIRSMCAAASHGTSASMANLKTEEIKRWPIPRVPLADQRAVVAKLAAARGQATTLIDAIDRQLVLLAERRQALIAAAVTGQIDVTTARGMDV